MSGALNDPHHQYPSKDKKLMKKMDVDSILNESGTSGSQPATHPNLVHRPRRRSKQSTRPSKIQVAMSLSKILNPTESTAGTPQAARPKYTLEQTIAMWYLRTDLELPWDSVKECFRRCFPQKQRGKTGLQCKFYRVIASWGVARVRAQTQCLPKGKAKLTDNDRDTAAYGVIERTDHVFPWMRPEHQSRLVRTGYHARLLPPLSEKPPHEPKQYKPPRASRL